MTKTKRLHDVFAECLEMVFRGESAEACLQRYPEHAAELRTLLETAAATRQAVAVQPEPGFREKARVELRAAMSQAPARTANRRAGFNWRWQSAWGVATASLAAIVVATTGTALASTGSMPDQPLYGVKMAVEQVRLALTPSADGRAELHAAFADRRVTEILYLAERGEAGKLATATAGLNRHLDGIVALTGFETLAASSRDTGGPSEMGVPDATEAQSASGADTPETPALPTAPPAATASPGAILSSPAPAAEKGSGGAAAPTANASDTVSGTGAFAGTTDTRLWTTVNAQAVNNSARLKAALLTVPPETKAALLRAIAVSETGYEKALQSLSQ